MIVIEFLIVFFCLCAGARIGGIGIGSTAGFGLFLLALIGIKPGNIPFDVIEIIMAIIAAIAAMQVAGGLSYLVQLTERLLQKHPHRITFLAPVLTYLMTIFTGTSYTVLATLPVIVEVAKKQGLRPSSPLSMAVVASQIAITASPISAAVIFMATIVEPFGISYLQLLSILIPATLIAVLLSAVATHLLGDKLKDDPLYQKRLIKDSPETAPASAHLPLPCYAKRSVLLFLLAIIGVMLYTAATSKQYTLVVEPPLSRNQAVVTIMLTAATFIAWLCKIDMRDTLCTSTFKSGMSACLCILGVAWLGDTFMAAHLHDIKLLAGEFLQRYPWLLAMVLFFASILLYSQAATAKALIPTALALGIPPITIIASFMATSALFVLPTYPTLLAAVALDDTGSTRIGRYVFNHSFLIPGIMATILAVAFGFLFGNLLL